MFLKRNQSWKRVTDAKLSGNFLSVRVEYLELLREKIKHLHFLPPKRSNRVRQLKKMTKNWLLQVDYWHQKWSFHMTAMTATVQYPGVLEKKKKMERLIVGVKIFLRRHFSKTIFIIPAGKHTSTVVCLFFWLSGKLQTAAALVYVQRINKRNKNKWQYISI